jgi:signal transduction histidine kinase
VASEGPPSVRVAVSIAPSLTVFADEKYLRRAVSNVVRNAVAYAGDAGPIQVCAAPRGDVIRLSVLDERPAWKSRN